MIDKTGRNINYLRISLTDRCNLRCIYCMPECGVKKLQHDDILTLEEIYSLVQIFCKEGINKIRLTGGEPLIRKGLPFLIEKISKIEGLKDIGLTTNGILLPEYAQDLKKAGLKRVNISLDTLNAEKYKKITRGGELSKALKGIEAAKAAGLAPIKINTVIIGGFNDDEIADFAKLTIDEDITVRFIELMPIGQAASWSEKHFLSNDQIKLQLKELNATEGEDIHDAAKYFRLPGAKGKIGFISPISHEFCRYCNRLRLTADGKLKPCLNADYEEDLISILRNNSENIAEEKLKTIINKVMEQKPLKHNIGNKEIKPIERDMFTIGG